LREASDLWDSGFFTLALAVLLVSILFAVHHTGSERAFWLGFALFGWGYPGLSLVPSIEPRLLTAKALAYLDSMVPGRSVGVLAFSPDGKLLPRQVRLSRIIHRPHSGHRDVGNSPERAAGGGATHS
jgi:hypothetical protein